MSYGLSIFCFPLVLSSFLIQSFRLISHPVVFTGQVIFPRETFFVQMMGSIVP